MTLIRFLGCLLIPLLLMNISVSAQETNTSDAHGLKDIYTDYFDMGASVAPRSLHGKEADLILRHFNSLTAENVMKMGRIHPEEEHYRWGPADAIVNFAMTNDLKVRGHTLCWHNQTPRWLFIYEDGEFVSKDELLYRLKSHIAAVVGRYKGQVYAWDVVNEAISDSVGEMYRKSPFYEICGKEYIAKAFEYAHAADPEAKLFYNDFSAVNPAKREKIVTMLKELLDAGVPVHGMGIQAHWSIYHPTEEEIRSAIETYSSLGLDIQITELDVSVYPSESGRRNKRPDEDDTFTPEMEARQVAQYEMIFRVLRDYADKISSVTFWNVSDRYSWLDSHPVRGRKNYPLLFDEDFKPKKAYQAVTVFKSR